MNNEGKTVVLKIGGSILSPSPQKHINVEFINDFKIQILKKYIPKNYKFIITIGGGYIARLFGSSMKKEGISDTYRHRVGVISTFLNATVFQGFISEYAVDHIVSLDDYFNLYNFANAQRTFNDEPVLLSCGGNRQESSTDMDAVLFAMRLGLTNVISMKGIDGVYSSDPKKDPSATLVKKTNWEDYFKLIGYAEEHTPGGMWPVDPIAAKNCAENGIKFTIVGSDCKNLSNYFQGKSFKGTIIA